MGKRFALLACASLCIAAMASAAGRGEDRKDNDDPVHGGVQRFATLPAAVSPTGVAFGHPEGLCADAAGNIYSNTFEFTLQNFIHVFDRHGNLITSTPTPGAQGTTDLPAAPLGCAVSHGKLYVNDVVHGRELEYALPLADTSMPIVYPICGGALSTAAPSSNLPPCFLNANYPGPDGRIYMSDNGDALFGDLIGRIWVLDPGTGVASRFIDNPPELMVAPGPYVGATPIVPSAVVLPFSANGIAFSRDGSALYIANMSTSIIYKQKVKHCGNPFTGCETNGGLSVFSRDPEHLIQGPDNMDFDDNGNLWVASGQNHHVIALDRQGDIVGVFGKFRGFDDQGAPKGLLQPSGIIFSRGKIYIGNESSQSLVRASENINWSALKLFTLSVVDPEVLDEGHPSDDHNDSYSHNYDDHSHNDRH